MAHACGLAARRRLARQRLSPCYARGVAIASTIVLSVLLIVALVTAGNQIGRRSVQ